MKPVNRNIRRSALIGLLSLLEYLFILIPTAFGAESTSFGIGYVRVKVVGEKYNEFQRTIKEFGAYQNNAQLKIEARRFLTAQEWTQLDELESREIKGERLKENEMKDLIRLRNLSKERGAKLRELQGTRDPTDEQKKDRQELESLDKANLAKVRQLGEELATQGSDKYEKLLEELRQKVLKAIGETAEAKGLKMVINTEALLWAAEGLDITDDVVKRLNASSQ